LNYQSHGRTFFFLFFCGISNKSTHRVVDYSSVVEQNKQNRNTLAQQSLHKHQLAFDITQARVRELKHNRLLDGLFSCWGGVGDSLGS